MEINICAYIWMVKKILPKKLWGLPTSPEGGRWTQSNPNLSHAMRRRGGREEDGKKKGNHSTTRNRTVTHVSEGERGGDGGLSGAGCV